MSSKLLQLQATLKQLQDYELPEKYQQQQQQSSDQPIVEQEVLRRYHDARNAYLSRRLQQVFYDHVSTWDGTSFQMPPVPTQEEKEGLQEQRREAQLSLREAAGELNHQTQLLQSKYVAFGTRRDELGRMVRELEQAERNESRMDDDDDEEDSMSQETVDQEEMVLEEQRLANLVNRKAELEAQLRGTRSAIAKTKAELEESNQEIQELRQGQEAADAENVGPRVVSPETILEVDPSEQDPDEVIAIQKKRTEELREISGWYDDLRETVEEVGGIKILSVDNAPKDEKEELLVVVQLLGVHKVVVGLESSAGATKRKRHNRDELRVSSAKFLTDTLVTVPSDDQQEDTVVQMPIPPLDDLVQISVNLGPAEDMRFLLRETVALIKTITARVQELSLLRTRYLTKIGKSCHLDYGFGGADQEIVCSLNKGVTVVLRLSRDCPMLDGSVYVDQIVGTGGWDQKVLDGVRDGVNSTTCRGPLMLMDELVQELERLETQEGVVPPRTPSMPARKAAGWG